MLVKLSEMEYAPVANMMGGEGTVSAKTAELGEDGKALIIRLPLGSSIGIHEHEDEQAFCYVSAGVGLAVCNGKLEKLQPGYVHFCPAGCKHSIANTGNKDLVLLCLVSKVSVIGKEKAEPAPVIIEEAAAEPVEELAPWASQIHARLVCGIHDLAPDQTVEGYKRFIDVFSREPWMHSLDVRDARAAYAAAWKEYWGVISAGDASVYSNWIQEMSELAR